ncbi:Olfactory receptor 10AG1 [Lemmus lemmus]
MLFGIFLLMYVITLLCNSIIILITRIDPALQTPMYFFLSNFSFVEICYVTVTIPRMLMDLCTQKGTIPLFSCALQLCFVIMFGGMECLLLTVMAYDRYVAICNPLHYPLIMNNKISVQLVAACWISIIPVVTGQTYQIFSLPYCGSNKINHFFCDIPPILKLACGDTFVNNLAIYVAAVAFIMVPFLLILASYNKIIATILKLPTATGQAKAFSTCSSHLVVVILFFGSGTINYFRPKSTNSAGTNELLSLVYTTVTPMFNPLIYSLRNKDMIAALRRVLLKMKSHRLIYK